ncbi:hypothetical protein GTO27_00320, partial [Candidatus Bathyarchaeota archaeon]|nr:hypothetical protein [Candidatus Bathyarchaeota archaeon]
MFQKKLIDARRCSLVPLTKSRRILKIDETHEIIFDDFRRIRLNEKADLVFADPPFGIDFKANLQTYHRSPDALSYVEVSKEHYPNFIQRL